MSLGSAGVLHSFPRPLRARPEEAAALRKTARGGVCRAAAPAMFNSLITVRLVVIRSFSLSIGALPRSSSETAENSCETERKRDRKKTEQLRNKNGFDSCVQSGQRNTKKTTTTRETPLKS